MLSQNGIIEDVDCKLFYWNWFSWKFVFVTHFICNLHQYIQQLCKDLYSGMEKSVQ
jgi:hypothetical protein